MVRSKRPFGLLGGALRGLDMGVARVICLVLDTVLGHGRFLEFEALTDFSLVKRHVLNKILLFANYRALSLLAGTSFICMTQIILVQCTVLNRVTYASSNDFSWVILQLLHRLKSIIKLCSGSFLA